MPDDSHSSLLIKAAQLIRTAPLDSDLKLLLIELVSLMDNARLGELLKSVEGFIKDSERDEEKLKTSLEQIKAKYDEKEDQLAKITEQKLSRLEGEIAEEEKGGKIKEVQKKIKEI